MARSLTLVNSINSLLDSYMYTAASAYRSMGITLISHKHGTAQGTNISLVVLLSRKPVKFGIKLMLCYRSVVIRLASVL